MKMGRASSIGNAIYGIGKIRFSSDGKAVQVVLVKEDGSESKKYIIGIDDCPEYINQAKGTLPLWKVMLGMRERS